MIFIKEFSLSETLRDGIAATITNEADGVMVKIVESLKTIRWNLITIDLNSGEERAAIHQFWDYEEAMGMAKKIAAGI